MEELIPLVFPFMHYLDTVSLGSSNRRMQSVVHNMHRLEGSYKTLTVHGMDSSDLLMDIQMSDYLLSKERRSSVELFVRTHYEAAESVVLYNYEEALDFFNSVVRPNVAGLHALELHNVTTLGNNISCLPESLTSLRMGLNLSPHCLNQSVWTPLNLPNLHVLELRGVPIDNPAVCFRWLIDSLANIRELVVLRICFTSSPDLVGPDEILLPPPGRSWTTSSLLSIELMTTTETSLSGHERKKFSAIANALIEAAKDGLLPRVQTFTLNCTPSKAVWESLSKAPSLMHLVVTNVDSVEIKLLATLIHTNARHLQILILKFAGKTNIHLDSIFHIILSAKGGFAPLERLELEVVMDETSGLMEAPYHTIKAAATLRCRYRDHMYFHRSKFGIAMAAERAYCTDTEADLSLVQSPMELFREEMVRGSVSDGTTDSGALEAAMINEWNAVGQMVRAIYVEIFDTFIDRAFADDGASTTMCNDSVSKRSGSTSKEPLCDVAATIANLRE